MHRLMLIVLVVFVAALSEQNAARAEPRLALVIGNSDYKLISPLANPRNDATLMASILGDLGFDVTLKTDVTQKAMKRAIRDFGQRLRRSGRETVGLFYYAGHGVQAYGRNYLIPLGAPIQDESDLDIETINANGVLRQMESAGNAVNILILDACRNNPFRSLFRSSNNGLGRMEAPRGSLVAFSADHETVAMDGRGANSPYTKALAKTMTQPGLPIEQVFKKVREEVEIATDGQQFPVEENRLKGNFYFIPPQAAAASPSTSGAQSQAGAATATQGSPSVDKEALFWEAIKDSEDPGDYRAYLQSFPAGVFAPLARARIANLEQDVAVLPPVPEEPEPTSQATDQSPDEDEIKQAIIKHYNASEAFSRGMTGVHNLEILDSSTDTVTVKFRYMIKAYASTTKTGGLLRNGQATLQLQGSSYEVTQFKER
jgi:uncharacterized caspase-like protein